MGKICVYTCITGEYDNLKEIQVKEKGIDYYCFTNNHNINSKTWNVVYINNDGIENHRLARKIKILGHKLLSDYNICMWQDASVVFNKNVSEFIKTYMQNNDVLCVPKHYCRDSVEEEAKACIKLKKDSEELIKKQLQFYKQEKFTDDLGLFETTVYIKYNKDKKLNETLKIWYEMIEKYSKRDQLSLTYAAFKTGLKITSINIVVWNNKWFKALPHNSYGKTYNVFYSSNDNDIYDTLDVYYYKKQDDEFTIEFKNKKNKFRICVADTEDILCTVVKTNCKLVSNELFFLDNSYFAIDNFVFLNGEKKANSKIKIVVKLEKMSKKAHSLLVKLNNKLQKKSNDINNLVNQNNDLKDEIRKIENSSSWKITKPLRAIKKIIRK